MRPDSKLFNRFRLFLPVQSPLQKYSGSLWTQITSTTLAIPAQYQGAFRDRHERGARDAMDADGAADESADFADGEVVWS
jgi:hypothetical protein